MTGPYKHAHFIDVNPRKRIADMIRDCRSRSIPVVDILRDEAGIRDSRSKITGYYYDARRRMLFLMQTLIAGRRKVEAYYSDGEVHVEVTTKPEGML